MKIRDQSGAVAIIVGLAMITLIGMASLAVDTGYLYLTRNELQNIADASALAAARSLGEVYALTSAYEDSSDRDQIVAVAADVAQKSRAGGKSPIEVRAEDVEIGVWDGNTFTPGGEQPNAIRSTVRRESVANGPVSTFFGRILGVNSVALSARATAALSGQSSTDSAPPFAISSAFFDYDETDCGKPISIRFTEDRVDCAGWHTYHDAPTDPEDAPDTIEQILQDMVAGTFDYPHIQAGDELMFTPQSVEQVADELQQFFADHNVDGVLQMNVAVFDNVFGCANPSMLGDITANPVVGFATIGISNVTDEMITATAICGHAEQSRGDRQYPGSSSYYHTMGSIPSLVE